MRQLEYTVRFLTPAFVGNAEQAGQWRTPPFKALLRQWWRMAVAHTLNFNVEQLRLKEGSLFGRAAEAKKNGDDYGRSKVRLRLDTWESGRLNQAPSFGAVTLGASANGGGRVAAALYLGYGPVLFKGGVTLKKSPAIEAGAKAKLALAFPEGQYIEDALALMNAYGTVGGRSRNGWGSFQLMGDHVGTRVHQRTWTEAMELDWPHALGRDQRGPLEWESQPLARWEDALRLLAQTRLDMRRSVRYRWMLAYPLTGFNDAIGWGADVRVPHSIRFKVRARGEQYVAAIFHIPCRPAEELWNRLPRDKQRLDEFVDCFGSVHRFLDKHSQFHRVEG